MDKLKRNRRGAIKESVAEAAQMQYQHESTTRKEERKEV